MGAWQSMEERMLRSQQQQPLMGRSAASLGVVGTFALDADYNASYIFGSGYISSPLCCSSYRGDFRVPWPCHCCGADCVCCPHSPRGAAFDAAMAGGFAMLLAEAWTLAQRWTDRISGDRVAVLAGGTSGLVATLALRLAGFTPVSVSPGLLSDLPSLAVHLEAHGISAVVHSAPPTQAYDLTWINLTTEIAGLDSLRLASKMASIYLLPKTLQAWWMRRKQPHFTTRQEAIGWLAPDASGRPAYRSLTHREILLQCEQLSSLDVIREGESVFCPDGYASFPGSLLGLWHPLLQGATLLTEPHRQNDAHIFLGDDALAAALAVSSPNQSAGARAFYCFNHEATSIAGTFAAALESRWHLTICPARYDDATQHLVSISLPNPPVTTSTGDPQTGHKSGSHGRLLPGYQARPTDSGLTLTSPDGLEIELPDSRLDSEDFLFTVDRE